MGKILGNIARDYNGILALIEGHAHMLKRQLKDDLDILGKNSLHSIIAATEQGNDLMHRLIQLGEFPPDPAERGDLVEVARHNQILMQSILGSGAEIDLHLPTHEIYIALCEEGITQILIGCILDARARHAGRISLSVSMASKKALLHFVDNGIETHGPDDSCQASHHDDSYYSDEWSMVNEWVQMAGGVMQHDFHATRGGDVLLSFPLAIQSANPFAEKTILVVDDGKGLPDLVTNHLQPFGVRILRAANAEQALIVQKQNPHPVDILLTHLSMPELNGVQLAEMLVADNPGLRVVYVTGNEEEGESVALDDELTTALKSAITLPQPLSLRKLSLSLEKALQMVQDMDHPAAS